MCSDHLYPSSTTNARLSLWRSYFLFLFAFVTRYFSMHLFPFPIFVATRQPTELRTSISLLSCFRTLLHILAHLYISAPPLRANSYSYSCYCCHVLCLLRESPDGTYVLTQSVVHSTFSYCNGMGWEAFFYSTSHLLLQLEGWLSECRMDQKITYKVSRKNKGG
jgi:hypothetical protein